MRHLTTVLLLVCVSSLPLVADEITFQSFEVDD